MKFVPQSPGSAALQALPAVVAVFVGRLGWATNVVVDPGPAAPTMPPGEHVPTLPPPSPPPPELLLEPAPLDELPPLDPAGPPLPELLAPPPPPEPSSAAPDPPPLDDTPPLDPAGPLLLELLPLPPPELPFPPATDPSGPDAPGPVSPVVLPHPSAAAASAAIAPSKSKATFDLDTIVLLDCTDHARIGSPKVSGPSPKRFRNWVGPSRAGPQGESSRPDQYTAGTYMSFGIGYRR